LDGSDAFRVAPVSARIHGRQSTASSRSASGGARRHQILVNEQFPRILPPLLPARDALLPFAVGALRLEIEAASGEGAQQLVRELARLDVVELEAREQQRREPETSVLLQCSGACRVDRGLLLLRGHDLVREPLLLERLETLAHLGAARRVGRKEAGVV